MRYLRAPTHRRTLQMTRALIVMFAALLLLSWNYGVRADGASGDLDPGFGTDGKVMTDFVVNGTTKSAYLGALAMQPDGKLIAAGPIGPGAFALTRYNPDGSLDSGFGVGGKVITELENNQYWADLRVVRIMPDGRVLVAGSLVFGYGGDGSLLARYTAEGQLDTSFGDDGKVRDRSIGITDLVAQADGHIVIATLSKGLIRFNPDGTPDQSMGNNFQLPNGGRFYGLAQQTDGCIIATGAVGTYSSEAFALIRFRSDGGLDPTFGTSGMVTTEMLGGGTVTQVAVMADGRILALGLTEWRKGGYSRPALARYHTDGSLDASFGEGGKALPDLGMTYAYPQFAIQPDGHIVIAVTFNNLTDDFEMFRVTPNGSPDLSFGYNGLAKADFSGRQDTIRALVAVGNDRIVAAGPSCGTDGSCFALACFMTTGTPHEPNPDFELRFNSSTIHATPGTRPRIAVNLYRTGGFTGDVTVTPPDLSAEGIICKAPVPATISGTSASWKFKVKGWAAPGPHLLTFIGRDATGRERRATVTLMVN